MGSRPLGLGRKCSLQEACKAHGLEHTTAHITSMDALAAARLARLYLAVMQARGVHTYADLARAGKYKFLGSFSRPPFDAQAAAPWPPCGRIKSRTGRPSGSGVRAEPQAAAQSAVQQYWDALTSAVADLEVSDEEVRELRETKHALGLTDDQIRALHARVFAAALTRMTDDELLSDAEARSLHRLRACLRELGWSPGD